MTNKKNKGLKWATRIFYILVACIIIFRIRIFIDDVFVHNYWGDSFIDLIYIFINALYVVILLVQFPYLFAKKEGKIKGSALYLVILILNVIFQIFTRIEANIVLKEQDVYNMFAGSYITEVFISLGILIFMIYYILLSLLSKMKSRKSGTIEY